MTAARRTGGRRCRAGGPSPRTPPSRRFQGPLRRAARGPARRPACSRRCPRSAARAPGSR
jgi:hypothetical protein